MKFRYLSVLCLLVLCTGCWGSKPAATDAGKVESESDARIATLQKQIEDLEKSKPVTFTKQDLARDFVGSPVYNSALDTTSLTPLPNSWVMFRTLDGRWFIVRYTPNRKYDIYGEVIELTASR